MPSEDLFAPVANRLLDHVAVRSKIIFLCEALKSLLFVCRKWPGGFCVTGVSLDVSQIGTMIPDVDVFRMRFNQSVSISSSDATLALVSEALTKLRCAETAMGIDAKSVGGLHPIPTHDRSIDVLQSGPIMVPSRRAFRYGRLCMESLKSLTELLGDQMPYSGFETADFSDGAYCLKTYLPGMIQMIRELIDVKCKIGISDVASSITLHTRLFLIAFRDLVSEMVKSNGWPLSAHQIKDGRVVTYPTCSFITSLVDETLIPMAQRWDNATTTVLLNALSDTFRECVFYN